MVHMEMVKQEQEMARNKDTVDKVVGIKFAIQTDNNNQWAMYFGPEGWSGDQVRANGTKVRKEEVGHILDMIARHDLLTNDEVIAIRRKEYRN